MVSFSSITQRILQSGDDNVNYSEEGLAGVAYIVVASLIFFFVAFNFLFPVNSFIPLDRRTTSVLGTLLCYLTRVFVFKLIDEEGSSFMLDAIDFNVFVLLTSIMVVNHLFVHLKETRAVIEYLQNLIKANPRRGFWMVSLAAFTISPFLTNDGVCLLFVEPILNAFDDCIEKEQAEGDGAEPLLVGNTSSNTNTPLPPRSAETGKSTPKVESKLELGDCLYFLLTLACSSNIGSALTYTGNPQNMIVASDSIDVLPSWKFLLYMLLPSISGWLITTLWIERWWNAAKAVNRAQYDDLNVHNPIPQHQEQLQVALADAGKPHTKMDAADLEGQSKQDLSLSTSYFLHQNSPLKSSSGKPPLAKAKVPTLDLSICGCGTSAGSVEDSNAPSHLGLMPFSPSSSRQNLTNVSLMSPVTPGRKRIRAREQLTKKVVHVVSSPVPYIVLILMVAMIFMIFVDVMPISSLICVSAVVMVLVVVIGNHWRNQKIWTVYEMGQDANSGEPLTPASATPWGGKGPHKRRTRKARGKNGSGGSNGSNGSHKSNVSRSTDGAGSYIRALEQAEGGEERTPATPATPATAGLKEPNSKAGPSNTNHEEEDAVLSREDKTANLQEFFEEMFGSIDYSLLVIFLGLFVVVAMMESTGVPKFIWDKLVGKQPFTTASSIVLISLFVLIASQLIGNVAVIQLAKPNVTYLDDDAKRMAWAILSYVATVGGNLTITGSAANIIVAEKALRLDPNMEIDFFTHYKVCFWVTLFVCFLGGVQIWVIANLETMISAYF